MLKQVAHACCGIAIRWKHKNHQLRGDRKLRHLVTEFSAGTVGYDTQR